MTRLHLTEPPIRKSAIGNIDHIFVSSITIAVDTGPATMQRMCDNAPVWIELFLSLRKIERQVLIELGH